MKKKIMVLLMAMVMVGGVLTGCGSEKEVAEPKNDKEVVVETEEKVEIEAVEEITEEVVFGENTVSLMEVFDTIYGESKSKECGDINVGNIIIYTTKVPASEANGVNDATLFDMYVIDSPMSVKNFNKGYIADVEEETKENTKPSYDEAIFRDRNDGIVLNAIEGTERYQITLSEADYESVKVFQSSWLEEDPRAVESLDLRFIDTNSDGVAEMVAFSYDKDDIMIAVGYANNDASVVTFGMNDYWLFETPVSESGENYVYYTAIEIPNSLSGKTLLLDTKDMSEDASIHHDALISTSWDEKLQYN